MVEWLVSNKFEAQLFMIFPCTDITPSLANKVRSFIVSLSTRCQLHSWCIASGGESRGSGIKAGPVQLANMDPSVIVMKAQFVRSTPSTAGY